MKRTEFTVNTVTSDVDPSEFTSVGGRKGGSKYAPLAEYIKTIPLSSPPTWASITLDVPENEFEHVLSKVRAAIAQIHRDEPWHVSIRKHASKPNTIWVTRVTR